MHITFYHSAAAPNKLDKSSLLTSIASFDYAQANTGLGVERPVINIKTSTDLSGANYCYISELSRYYNIRDISIPVAGLYSISCEVDVLMTYASSIMNLTGIVSRQSENYDMYLKDSLIPIGAHKSYSIMKFPTNAFGSGQDSRIFIQTLGGD